MSTSRDLLEGIAGALAAAGVGVWQPPTGVFQSGDTAIVFGDLQPDPDRQIALTLYSPNDSVILNYSEYRVQCYMRGAPYDSLDVDDLADAVFDALHHLTDQQWGSVWLAQASRSVNSSAIHGLDANMRSERADNYVLMVNPPNTSRRPL